MLICCPLCPCVYCCLQAAASPDASSATPTSARVEELYRQIEVLETKLDMSRGIMKKLYYKTVHLEKEAQLAKANSNDLSPPAPLPPNDLTIFAPSPSISPYGSVDSPDLKGQGSAQRNAAVRSTTPSAQAASSPVVATLHERDQTISELQSALDASRRRCAMLETQLAMAYQHVDDNDIRDAMAQSVLHQQKYKQIREEYHKLLANRAAAVTKNSGPNTQAKQVLKETTLRLHREVEDREAEAALYSARLYDLERQLTDWYVDKRMLEDHIAKLNEEIQARDRLDQEIQSALVSMYEKQAKLEEASSKMSDKLKELGVDPDTVTEPTS